MALYHSKKPGSSPAPPNCDVPALGRRVLTHVIRLRSLLEVRVVPMAKKVLPEGGDWEDTQREDGHAETQKLRQALPGDARGQDQTDADS